MIGNQMIDEPLHEAIDALYDASGWLADGDDEQVFAAIEDARELLRQAEEALEKRSEE